MSCVHPAAAYLPRLTTDWLLKIGSQPVLRMHTPGLQWIYDNAEKIGVDREKIAVCGDSSGGNFAAVVCQMARDRSGVPIRNQVLIYPNTDFVMAGWKSAETVGSGYYCTKDALLWYWNHYVGDSYDLENPYLCPMRAKSFANLPDAYVVVASYDPLHDEGEAYAKALEARE